MFRPGVGHLSQIITHSGVGDKEFFINTNDLSGGREGWYSELIERKTPIFKGRFNRISKKDYYLNKKDMNVYGHFTQN